MGPARKKLPGAFLPKRTQASFTRLACFENYQSPSKLQYHVS